MSKVEVRHAPRRGKRKGKQSKGTSNNAILERIAANTNNNVAMPNVDLSKEMMIFPRADKFDGEVYNAFDSYENLAALSSSATVPTFVGSAITAGGLSNFPDMSAAFDQYRIRAVQYNFYPRTVSVNNNSSIVGLVHSVIDFDDASAPTSIAQCLAYSNCYVCSGLTAFTRTFTPRLALAAYGGAFTQFANADPHQWIDCASSNVQYYGLKTGWTVCDGVYHYDTVIRVWIQYRNSR